MFLDPNYKMEPCKELCEHCKTVIQFLDKCTKSRHCNCLHCRVLEIEVKIDLLASMIEFMPGKDQWEEVQPGLYQKRTGYFFNPNNNKNVVERFITKDEDHSEIK